MLRLDRKALGRFINIAKPFFVSEVKWKARGLLILLATFSITVSFINVRISYIGRDFMTALSLKEKNEFFYQLYKYINSIWDGNPCNCILQIYRRKARFNVEEVVKLKTP